MINPIFESGARRRMRTPATPLILTAYVTAMLVFSLGMLSIFMGQGVRVMQMRLSTEWMIWVTALQFALIVLVAPALGAGSIAGERERQTFDLLRVTGVSARRIVLGKLAENYAFLLLLIMSGLPVMMLAYATGGVSWLAILAILAYLAIIALGAQAVGMVMSAVMRRSLPAIIASYLMIFAIGAGTWALAKHGPLAANYTYDQLQALASMPTLTVLAIIPPTLYFNPAIALVMLLAGQTGILHTTMRDTMRLFDIYTAAKAAGFLNVSLVSILAVLLCSLLLVALAIVLLRGRASTGRRALHAVPPKK